jgi:hypothetical protein
MARQPKSSLQQTWRSLSRPPLNGSIVGHARAMPLPKTNLEKLRSEHGRMVKDPLYKDPVFQVDSPHAFVQAIGYLKHLAGTRGNVVAYRGQRKLYDAALVPSLFRGVTTQKMKAKREQQLGALLNGIARDKAVLQAVNKHAREPLLQHYGINTRWVDLVDNVWVGLWFACYRAYTLPRRPRFLHFERRDRISSDENAFAYVLVLEVERGVESAECRGLFEGVTGSWIDLRVASPSHFVRPHAQHGLLFRKKVYADYRDVDCSAFVVGVVRVRLTDAFDWIGQGRTLSAHAFFPPPLYDFGYRELLSEMPEVDEELGAIQHIGA